MKKEKSLYLIDGTAYIYRAYHAIRNLSNSKGLPTNAAFGFTRMLLKLIEDRNPEHLVMFFDAKGPTFRHEMYKEYKANRPAMPEDLSVQIPYIKEITKGFNLKVIEMPGFEADDLIGTFSRLGQDAGFHVIMVTGDKDFMQLVTENAVIWDPMKDKTIDVNFIEESFGLRPSQMIDVMGLSGDTADNIPGVPGIGPTIAASLIKTFGSIKELYEKVDSITKKKQHENLVKYKDQAFLSKKLVTIDTNAPISLEPDQIIKKEPDADALSKIFKNLEFKQLSLSYSQKSDLSKKKYTGVFDTEALTDLISTLNTAGLFAVDTETTSKNPMRADLVGLSFAVKPDEAFYIPCAHVDPDAPAQLPLSDVLKALQPLLENPEIKKVGQNIKYDQTVLKRHGIDLKGIVFDTMVASYLIDPSKRSHSLDRIAMDFLDHKTISFEEVAGKGNKDKGLAEVPVEKAVPYACEDADITLMAHNIFQPMIKESGLEKLFEDVEMPLLQVLMAMEMEGILVDKDKLCDLSSSFGQQLTTIQEEVYQIAGEEFNLNSSQQLGRILFEKLQLPVQKKTKKKTGYSTDVDVLTTLSTQHELPALILRHRTLAKLKSTYTDALIELIHPETGRIHTSYNQTVTATGRLSSSEPNLQNIPIRSDEGKEIRKAFIPKPGCLLIAVDYSQVELRILAHYADDKILIKAFEADEDIHTRTAREVFQVLPSFLTPDLRRQAKAINFGIVYGMSPFGLAKELGISQKMAKNYIDGYFARYKGVKSFIENTIEEARRTGKTSTLLGRIRPLPDINSSNKNMRMFAERTAINTPIQGTAADLIKLAMIKVDAVIREKSIKSVMLLSVHDEIVLETPEDEVDAVKSMMKRIMENVWNLKVPLKVNIGVGKNWAEAH
jgi:DNA polymerase-1